MDLRQLLGSFQMSPTQELDDIIGEDMQVSHAEMGGVFGKAKYSPSTMDRLLEFADSEEREDGLVSLTGYVLRKAARMIYEGGEEQEYATVLNLHRDIRALLEISKEAESSYSWNLSGFEAAIAAAERLGLPKRAALLRKHVELAKEYHNSMLELHEEVPCYDVTQMEEHMRRFNAPSKEFKTGEPTPEAKAQQEATVETEA